MLSVRTITNFHRIFMYNSIYFDYYYSILFQAKYAFVFEEIVKEF